jgi:threonylcarbamoyladenosine tRNA methylthiotransferase MtaB
MDRKQRHEKTFCIVTQGCRVNQEEAECLRSQLLARGFREVPVGEPADLTVLNTCTVTAAGDSDARQMLRRLRRISPRGRIVATGCYAQRAPEEVAQIGAADLLVGNRRKADLDLYLSLLEEGSSAGEPRVVVDSDPTPVRWLRHARGWAPARTRAVLKIQDGCSEHCTYCIIPSVRGPSVSRPAREVLEEARTLVAAGSREIVLTGVHTGSYRSPEGWDLARLIAALEPLEGLRRIRLASLEPGTISERLLEVLARSRKLCPHLHVPLQSGDDAILRRMGRSYGTAAFRELLARVRRARPGVAIGTDVMVGFPGETEEAFQRTLAFVREMDFAYLHVFSFSPRPGAPATRLGPPVAKEEASRRSRTLRALDRELRRRHMARRRGQEDWVLVETTRRGRSGGLTGDYLRVILRGPVRDPGSWVRVRIEEPADDLRVWGRPVTREGRT